MKSQLIFAMLSIFAAVSYADDHSLTSIKGDLIDLKSADHAIAGSIGDAIVFGQKVEGKFESELIIKKQGQVTRTTFATTQDGRFGGTISGLVAGNTKETKLELKKWDKKAETITFSVNNQDYIVQITSDGFANEHFKNPTYSLNVNGKTYSFHIENGDACYGYSTQLIFMIYGALFHTEIQ